MASSSSPLHSMQLLTSQPSPKKCIVCTIMYHFLHIRRNSKTHFCALSPSHPFPVRSLFQRQNTSVTISYVSHPPVESGDGIQFVASIKANSSPKYSFFYQYLTRNFFFNYNCFGTLIRSTLRLFLLSQSNYLVR